MPLNDCCLSNSVDVKSASARLATMLVEAAATGPPFRAFYQLCVDHLSVY